MGWHARRFGVIDAVGLTALVTYLLAALDILPVIVSERVTLALVFAIGPVAMMAVIGIHLLLRSSPAVFWLRVGTTFLIVAFGFLNLMLVVQQMVRLQFRASVRRHTTPPKRHNSMRSSKARTSSNWASTSRSISSTAWGWWPCRA